MTSGSEQDLKDATQLARRMMSQWGMSDRLGAVAFRRGEQHVFLGQEMTEERDYSERTAQLIDDEVRRLLGELEGDAEQRLKTHRDELDALAAALVERETLSAAEIRTLLHTNPAFETQSADRRCESEPLTAP
jgi:cell division protease FtsH